MCFTAAAPISRDTLEFFLSLGVPIYEIFGMSETTGPGTLSLPHRYKTGTCGFPLPGTDIKIAEDGELLLRGPHIFKGYYKNEKATKEAIDEDGWLHSGDIAEFDEEGYVKITDRKKDIIITAGGKNIAPQVIEGKLKDINKGINTFQEISKEDMQKQFASSNKVIKEVTSELEKIKVPMSKF